MPQGGLGLPIAVQRRMDIEVVGGEVQPHPHRGAVAPAVAKAEGGRLHHKRGWFLVADGLYQRRFGVPGHAHRHTGGLQHGRSQQGYRRLAVGAGHRQGRTDIPPLGQVELGDHQRARFRRGLKRGMGLGQPGGGDHRSGTSHQGGPVVGGGTLSQFDANGIGLTAKLFVGGIVGGHHRTAAFGELGGHRLVGDAEAHQQHRVAAQCGLPVNAKSPSRNGMVNPPRRPTRSRHRTAPAPPRWPDRS